MKLFCPECGSMMFPAGGMYSCKKCKKQIEITGAAKVSTTKSNAVEMTVLNGEDATLPKAPHLCPKCGHSEAYFVIRQMRAADEPESRFYRCCKCNFSVRED